MMNREEMENREKELKTSGAEHSGLTESELAEGLEHVTGGYPGQRQRVATILESDRFNGLVIGDIEGTLADRKLQNLRTCSRGGIELTDGEIEMVTGGDWPYNEHDVDLEGSSDN